MPHIERDAVACRFTGRRHRKGPLLTAGLFISNGKPLATSLLEVGISKQLIVKDHLPHPLNHLTTRMAGGPGPLEVEAAEVAGDVDGLADEIEAGDGAGFHGF